jgi:5-carboxymethyl-2-hydroxymuconic-semialdehyde dehydrogenase
VWAAYATARPKFPPEAAITPAGGTSDARSLLNAPRGLNEPVCWVSSSLSVRRPGRPSAPSPSQSTGVRRTYPAIRSRAASTSARPISSTSRPSNHRDRLDVRGPAFISFGSERPAEERSPRTGASAVIEGVEVSTEHWIGGERVGSPQAFADVSPIDETTLAEIARGTAEEADRAVAAAQDALATWGRTPPKQRAETLHRIADLIEERVPQLAAVETRDNGSLLRSMRNSVMPRVARNFRFFADQLMELGESFEMSGFESRTEWDPAGVTAVITPWNAPLMLATWRVAPALAAGNPVVLKPPEWAPLTASMLADICREAGLPDGAFNVLQGIGEEAGAALARHPGLGRIAFTGSVETGKLVAQAAAANLTPASLELGGKSPFVAFADADLDAVVKQAVNQYDNAGQVCLAGTRLIVERSMHDAFLERFLEAARALRQGDPRDEATDLGPLIAREHFERVDGFVRRAITQGARPLLGGGPNEELGGLYYRPTLFVDVPAGAEVLRKEVFGPVLTLQAFDDEDEAIALANETEYGLAAIVYTGDRARAERVAERLVAGTVWVNCFYVRDLRAPFGGARASGIGREGGTYSFDFYADVKNVCMAPWA